MIFGAAFLVPLLVLTLWFVSAASNSCNLVQNLGYIYLAKGTLASQRTQLATAERLFSTLPAECRSSAATYGLGQSYAGLGQGSPAVSALKSGQEPANLRHLLIGQLYEEMGRPGDARLEYRKLPRDAAGYFYRLGDLAEKQGDFDAALHDFSVSAIINPSSPKPYYRAASVYARLAAVADKSIAMMGQALPVDPRPTVARQSFRGLQFLYQLGRTAPGPLALVQQRVETR